MSPSFEVGDREHSAVFEAYVLDADEFPAVFAQEAQVILNVVHYWLTTTFKVV